MFAFGLVLSTQPTGSRARWYDPNSGRFISEDPIGFGDGPNPYRYAGNNPILFVDPSGLEKFDLGRLKFDWFPPSSVFLRSHAEHGNEVKLVNPLLRVLRRGR